MNNEECEGWRNYATFGVAVVLDNDRALASKRRSMTKAAVTLAPGAAQVLEGIWTESEAARFTLADALKDWIERELERAQEPCREPFAGMVGQLVQAGLGDVDWSGIAAHDLEELELEKGASR